MSLAQTVFICALAFHLWSHSRLEGHCSYEGVCVCVIPICVCVSPSQRGAGEWGWFLILANQAFSLQSHDRVCVFVCVCLKGRGADFDEPLRIEEDTIWASEQTYVYLLIFIIRSFSSCFYDYLFFPVPVPYWV